MKQKRLKKFFLKRVPLFEGSKNIFWGWGGDNCHLGNLSCFCQKCNYFKKSSASELTPQTGASHTPQGLDLHDPRVRPNFKDMETEDQRKDMAQPGSSAARIRPNSALAVAGALSTLNLFPPYSSQEETGNTIVSDIASDHSREIHFQLP